MRRFFALFALLLAFVPVLHAHPKFRGVKSAKLVVLFDGLAEIWNVGLHRVGINSDLPQ